MNRLSARGFTLVELMVVIAIIGLLASVLATSVVSKMQQASHDLDKKVLQDLYNNLQMKAATDDKTREKFVRGPIAETKGREFWEACFKYKVFDHEMLPKMVCSGGDDFEMDRRSLDDPSMFILDPLGCSWTGPEGKFCLYLLSARGKARRVAICVNSRNWFNYEDEILTIWSDGETAEYITLEQLEGWGYEITPEQWDMPAEELIGKVKPFDGVHD